MTKDEIVGWHHRLNGREFEQAPGAGDGQGSLACCSPCGCSKSDRTELTEVLVVALRIFDLHCSMQDPYLLHAES